MPTSPYQDPGFVYDVALSFAGEDRAHANSLASLLTEQGVRVFYDDYEKSNLWGKDLAIHFSEIYTTKARYCIIFVSSHYASKLWTKHEHRAAQARALQESAEYILPIRVDDTEVPGILSTVGYLDLRKVSIDNVAFLLLEKLAASNRANPPAEDARTTGPSNAQLRTSGLAAFGPNIVACGRIISISGGDTIVFQIDDFWQGDLRGLVAFCADPAPEHQYVAFSSLLDVHPLAGAPQLLGDQEKYLVRIPILPSWEGSCLAGDLDILQPDAPLQPLGIILTRRLNYSRPRAIPRENSTNRKEEFFREWLYRLDPKDPNFTEVLRLVLVIVGRLPSELSRNGFSPKALFQKVDSIEPSESLTDQSGSLFHRVKITANTGAFLDSRTWDVDVRLSEGRRTDPGPWILISCNPTRLTLTGGGAIEVDKGPNFITANLSFWQHLDKPEYASFRTKFAGSGLVTARVHGREGLTPDEIVRSSRLPPQTPIYWCMYVHENELWSPTPEGEGLRASSDKSVGRIAVS